MFAGIRHPVGGIEHLLQNNPEYRLVGETGGLFRRRRVYVHIVDGKLVGTAEISRGLLGERGQVLLPAPITGNPQKYFADLGVPEKTYKEIIEPVL